VRPGLHHDPGLLADQPQPAAMHLTERGSRRLESATATGTGTSPSSAGCDQLTPALIGLTTAPPSGSIGRGCDATIPHSLQILRPARPVNSRSGRPRRRRARSSSARSRDPVKIIIRHLENASDLVGSVDDGSTNSQAPPTLCGCGRISLPRSSIMSHFTEKPRRTRRRQVVNSRSTIESKEMSFMARVLRPHHPGHRVPIAMIGMLIP